MLIVASESSAKFWALDFAAQGGAQAMDDDTLVDPKVAARILGITQGSLRSRVSARGRERAARCNQPPITPRKVGKLNRFSLRELREYMNHPSVKKGS